MSATRPPVMASSGAATSAPGASSRWLFGPVSDLVFGCGIGYAIWIAIVPFFRFDPQTATAIGLLSTFLIATPHYGATLLRVYGSRRDLTRYAFFTIYLSAFVWLVFVVGLYELAVGSLLITVYLTWSPWHYAGQNYGLAVMFLRRRGVPLSDSTKRWLYASFILSFALTLLMMHSAVARSSSGVGSELGTHYTFLELGIPGVYGLFGVFSLVLVGYVVALAIAGRRLLRVAPAMDLVPVACLVLTQATWFTVPHVWRWATGVTLASQTVSFVFVWAILGHSIQYLWVTTYYAVGRAGGRPRWAYLFATLAAGSVVWTLPVLVFSPRSIGNIPYDMGLFLMIAAAVNVQHFILDGAIWKLRDTFVGNILLAGSTDDQAADAKGAWPRWVRGVAWTLGIAMFAVGLFGDLEHVFFKRALLTGDEARAAEAQTRLDAIGRGDPRYPVRQAQAALDAGSPEVAISIVRESLERYPLPEAWLVAARAYEEMGDGDLERQAYRECLELDPSRPKVWHRLGMSLAEEDRVEEAVDALERAKGLAPEDVAIATDLFRLRKRARQGS